MLPHPVILCVCVSSETHSLVLEDGSCGNLTMRLFSVVYWAGLLEYGDVEGDLSLD